MLPPGNPRGYQTLADALADGARIVNRNRGSGTRVAIDRLLATAGIAPPSVAGYGDEVTTHGQAACVVADGDADVALGIFAAAKAEGLDFVPVLEERYDLVTPTSVYESGLLDALLALLRKDRFKRAVRELGGYSTRETGRVAALPT